MQQTTGITRLTAVARMGFMENSVKVIAVPPPCASIQGSINSKAVVLDNI